MTEDENAPFIFVEPNDDSKDAQWLRELFELAARGGVGVVPAWVRDKEVKGYFMRNVQLIEQEAKWTFSEWFPLERQQIDISYRGGRPGYPGIYDIGLAVPIQRLNGESQIFYIGRGASQSEGDKGTIAGSLHRHIDDGCPSEKWFRLHSPHQQLLARVAIANDVGQAKYWEKLRLRWFNEQHWEQPIGNRGAFFRNNR